MNILLRSGLLILLLLSGCGFNGTPTRQNDFVPLTSIEIVAVTTKIAMNTSTTFTVTGNYSGLFTRDVTSQVVWSSGNSQVASFATPAVPNRVTGVSSGTALLTATIGSVSTNITLNVSSATATAVTVTPTSTTMALGLTQQFTASGTFNDGSTQDITFDVMWASGNTSFVTVSNTAGSNGLATPVAITTTPVTISATFEGFSGASPVTVVQAILESITVTPATPAILSLSSETFTATGTYSDKSTQNITSSVTWTSGTPIVATVDSTGNVTTLTQGTTVITAALGGVSGTYSLNVTGGTLNSISITPAPITLSNGATGTGGPIGTYGRVTATGTFTNGSNQVTRDITGAVTWGVANANFATLTNPTPGGNLEYLVASPTNETTTTTVTATAGTLTASTTLALDSSPLASITISPLSLNPLAVGTSGRFTLKATFQDGTTQDVTANAVWSSGNSASASFSFTGLANNGRIFGDAAGTSTVSATFGGLTATASVTVVSSSLQSIALNTSGNAAVYPGNQVAYTLTATFSNGTTQNVTEDATWSVTPASVAILADNTNQPGQVVYVAAGTATLSATFSTLTGTATVTVP